jgi:triacylglycerol lipase
MLARYLCFEAGASFTLRMVDGGRGEGETAMSFVVAAPEMLASVAADVAGIGSSLSAANAAAAAPTTAVMAAAGDEVSAAITAVFSSHAQQFQALSAQAAAFHDQFVQILNSGAWSYASTEAANASPMLQQVLKGAQVAQLASWGQTLENSPGLPGQFDRAIANGFAFVEQEIQQTSTTLTTGITRVANTVFTGIFGSPADPPFLATQSGTFTGTPSLATRFEIAGLWGAKDVLGLSGLETTQIEAPSSPVLSLFTGNNPLLGLFIGNSPPQLLPLLLGETVQHTTYNGMSVVQITPADPSGNYVVAIHGGAFIFPPSIFHWLDYTVMAYQTGATIEVPIYPLLQQGGTAGTVVPQMAGFISTEIAAHGAPHVSVIGDSSGGNLALAATEYLVANGDPVPASMVLLSPWLNLAMTNPNIAFVQDPLLSLGPAQVLGKEWAGNLPVSNPMVSPLNGSLRGLPPTTVYSGNMDILSPDVLVLQQEAATAGAPMSFVLANGEIHDWILLTPDGLRYWPQIDQELGI